MTDQERSSNLGEVPVDKTVWPNGGALLEPQPSWARWNETGDRYTLGVEEEVMLLQASDHSLAQASDEVLARLSGGLASHTTPETHAAVVELVTDIHVDPAGAASQLHKLRAQLVTELHGIGLDAMAAGTYPLAVGGETVVSHRPRYREVAGTMRTLAHREPTLALHAHIGVPNPEDAIRVLNGLREVVALLLALSANSPFSQGRDTGFASTRTTIFQAFPRTGTPRRFVSYDDYVRAVDALVASGAVPDPSFLWWDLRLQPRLGTVELRVMDSQSAIEDTAALVALVQSLTRSIVEDGGSRWECGPEVLAENRFLAARDGLEARLIDPSDRRLVPVRTLLEGLIERCRPHAAALGCLDEFSGLEPLVRANGADRQRAIAEDSGVDALVTLLSERFSTIRRN
jgi:carboxylate-amine ligase